MTTMAVSSSDLFNIWAKVYDEQPNPLLALEQRFLSRMLPDIAGLDVLDAGCGTGRWLQLLASHRPASLVGVDTSPEMLQPWYRKHSPTALSMRLRPHWLQQWRRIY